MSQRPVNLGAAGVFEQAFLMSLYDPQRARVMRYRKDPRSLRTFGEEIGTAIARAAQDNRDGPRVGSHPPVNRSCRYGVQENHRAAGAGRS